MKPVSYRIMMVRLLGLIGLTVMIHSCQNDYFVPHPRPVPKVAEPTEPLEANYLSSAPTSINDAYWKTANYLKVNLANLNTGNLYTEDGRLNATGTYAGLSGFNPDDSIDLRLQAAYTDDKVYILIEWTDNDKDASLASMLFNGPVDDRKPSESADGWTAQRNTDQVALAFNIDNPDFATQGCQASCHNGIMEPNSGSIDIWNWNLALSDPLGYALDMQCTAGSGLVQDAGTSMYQSNRSGSDFRSGPLYEWDGVRQDIEKPDGSKTFLDPGFYLYNKTGFTGSPSNAVQVYEDYCGHNCHGLKGEGFGPDGDGPAFNKPGKMNQKSRQAIIDFAGSHDHTGEGYFAQLSAQEVEDVIALIRGFTGVPGFYLQQPDGSNADVIASSNVISARIEPDGIRYRVMMVRALQNGNSDDVQFDPDTKTEYPFGIALMDADGKNHVGSLIETLTFIKP